MKKVSIIGQIRAIQERLGEDASQDNADAKWLLARLLELRVAASQAVDTWHAFGYNEAEMIERMDALARLATE